MKELYKDFMVGFVVVVLACGLIFLFCVKPEFLVLLIFLAMVVGLFYLCYVIGKNIRASDWYENLILYIKRMLNKEKKKGE